MTQALPHYFDPDDASRQHVHEEIYEATGPDGDISVLQLAGLVREHESIHSIITTD